MLSIAGPRVRLCDGLTRREVLRAGALTCGGLTLADLLRRRAAGGGSAGRGKSVIMVWLRGGASHIDSFDLKPDAPAEIRGEFHPIATRVPGLQLCEHLPLHAELMDKLAIVRGIRSNDLGDHTPHYIMTGFPDRGKRPAFGSVVSYLRPRSDGLPPYVSLMYEPPGLYDYEGPTYTGPANRPFAPRDEGLANLTRHQQVSQERLQDRRELLRRFDNIRRDLEAAPAAAGLDEFQRRALDLVTAPAARDAFDLSRESDQTRERYGGYCENLLRARRLVEAGIPVVTLKLGDWDTHEHNFRDMRDQLPRLDRGVHALVTELSERGLERDVAVVVWGEFGRAPQITRIAGRDHWPEAGAAVIAGGGFRVGQAIGATDAQGGRSTGNPYTPSNVLATLYRHLGIDPQTSIPDYQGRPQHVLDELQPVREL